MATTITLAVPVHTAASAARAAEQAGQHEGAESFGPGEGSAPGAAFFAPTGPAATDDPD